MRIGFLRFSWVAALAASWGMSWSMNGAIAQDRPSKGILGGLSSRRETPRSVETNPSRMMEVQVELALMGDPITFPYFLEARSDGARLELRGFVPDKNVQDHAVKLARMNSTLPVVDTTRLHSSLTVKSTKLPPEKLYASVHSALSRALPVSSKSLRIETDNEGKVVVSGTVKNIDEKLAVSQSLRRLHGCGCVVNLTNLEGAQVVERRDVAAIEPPVRTPPTKAPTIDRKTPDILPVQAKEPARMPALPASTPAPPSAKSEGPFGGFFGKVFGRKKTPAAEAPKLPPSTTPREPVKITTSDAPPRGTNPWGNPPKAAVVPGTPTSKSGGTPATTTKPYEASGVIVAPSEVPAVKKGKTLTPAQLRSRLDSAFPKARPIAITPQGGNKIKIELTARNSEESNDIAGRLLSMPELESYDVDLHIRVDAPASK